MTKRSARPDVAPRPAYWFRMSQIDVPLRETFASLAERYREKRHARSKRSQTKAKATKAE